MNNYEDFTIDTTNFNITDMETMTNLDNVNGVHWVPIIDAGIKKNSDWT